MQFQRFECSSKGYCTQLEDQEVNQEPDARFDQLHVPATGHGQVRLELLSYMMGYSFSTF